MQYKISDELVDYETATNLMEQQVANIILGNESELLWFVQHPPLYTSGTSAKEKDLLDKTRFPIYQTGRGGEFTYHGPGQRVAYVMLNLKERQAEDLKAYVRNLEQWLINSLARFGVQGRRRQGRVGIWVVKQDDSEAKIAAIGIRVRKWVTFHGISININPDLSHFNGIVPCGISTHGVTSLHDLGIAVTMEQVDKVLKEEFDKIF